MKVTISELEKELKKIYKNLEIAKCDDGMYRVFTGVFRRSLCQFRPGTIEGLSIDSWSADPQTGREMVNKIIETIPYLVPDDYKEPTMEELFNEFKKNIYNKGFYIIQSSPSSQYLRFEAQKGNYTVGVFDKKCSYLEPINLGDAPKDKYLEGLKLLINYAEKVRSLEPVKLYEIPLPGLRATDGEKQYLSTKNGYYFTCRKNNELKQTWTEKELINVPKAYREYAVEVEDEGC